MSSTKNACQTLPKWLKTNLGPRCLASLTGTDTKALAAAVQIIELYAYQPKQEVLDAFRAVVVQMQRSCWLFAYHAIAHIMEWDDREKLWSAAKLPAIEAGLCRYEPDACSFGGTT